MRVSQISKVPLMKASSDIPQPGEWAPCYTLSGEFMEQIVANLLSEEALKHIVMHVNGSGVQIGGRNLVIEVRSLLPSFSPAGTSACNMILPPPDGGPCL